jgi:hypothetical protein
VDVGQGAVFCDVSRVRLELQLSRRCFEVRRALLRRWLVRAVPLVPRACIAVDSAASCAAREGLIVLRGRVFGLSTVSSGTGGVALKVDFG